MSFPNVNGFGIIDNPLTESLYSTNNSPSTVIPSNDFILMSGDFFLLMNGTNFLLMG